jgi:regulator of replication initiation timing
MSKNPTKLTWSDAHEKLYKQLFNKLIEVNNKIKIESYLLNYNKRNLMKFIKDLPLSDSTRESLLFMVARYLELNKPNDTSIIDFKNAGYKFKTTRQDKEGENQLDTKEQNNYQSLLYFEELLKQKTIESTKDKAAYYGYLITALTTLQPPLRTDFYTSCKFSDGKEIHDGGNYLVIQKTKDFTRLFYKVGNDKVSNSKYYKTKPNLDVIEIENKELVNIILKSYEMYKRAYLFENNNGQPIKPDTLLQYLKTYTNIKGLTVNMMRSIYITTQYNKRISYKDKENLAHKMRHSILTASKNYFKLTEDDKPTNENEEIEQFKKEIELLRIENNKLKVENENLKQMNEPDKNTSDFKKKRRDVILYANKKGSTIKEDTLNKYDIKYDETTKKYS